MLEDVYNYLVRQYKIENKDTFDDEYEGQNLLSRKANIYAIKNTANKWRELQYERTRLSS